MILIITTVIMISMITKMIISSVIMMITSGNDNMITKMIISSVITMITICARVSGCSLMQLLQFSQSVSSNLMALIIISGIVTDDQDADEFDHHDEVSYVNMTN